MLLAACILFNKFKNSEQLLMKILGYLDNVTLNKWLIFVEVRYHCLDPWILKRIFCVLMEACLLRGLSFIAVMFLSNTHVSYSRVCIQFAPAMLLLHNLACFATYLSIREV